MMHDGISPEYENGNLNIRIHLLMYLHDHSTITIISNPCKCGGARLEVIWHTFPGSNQRIL